MNLSQEVLASLDKALETIIGEVERRNPAIVVVDSFRSLAQTVRVPAPDKSTCRRSSSASPST